MTAVPPQSSTGPGRTDDVGATFIALILATCVALVILTGIIQVLVFQYGKGSVRAALDEAARAAARSPNPAATCAERANDVLDDLLGGELGNQVTISCDDQPDRVIVTADVHFDGWFGNPTDYDTTLVASAAKGDR